MVARVVDSALKAKILEYRARGNSISVISRILKLKGDTVKYHVYPSRLIKEQRKKARG